MPHIEFDEQRAMDGHARVARLRAENDRLRAAALDLLEHPRSARAALAMYEALGTDPLRERQRLNAR